ncbi:hypothetical protein OS493_023173 [Desmophyllum pertusum]|uniref:Uncharacterized protein n=1 Tax=Desmophyllum pertusum TaxID=174260 RepID=A0A9X0CQM5_9CNID|nr:hypothetical protein OS493_023173 [Desmophyllum pertusum]
MLKIPGIEQSPDVPLANLPEVFENLIELDKTTDAVKSPEASCDIEDKKPEDSDICGVSSSSPGSRIQADVPVPSLSVRSPSVGAKTPTNPLKVEIKDFRKVLISKVKIFQSLEHGSTGTTQVKKETTPTELE